ncbi:MAG: right-handed parallel beta-helix repeat-containing protein [Micromonosporaceae bacterium]|nr:right-handed parallel beta-helix repeat-containing protein [Micromonosporaceae bacterium]
MAPPQPPNEWPANRPSAGQPGQQPSPAPATGRRRFGPAAILAALAAGIIAVAVAVVMLTASPSDRDSAGRPGGSQSASGSGPSAQPSDSQPAPSTQGLGSASPDPSAAASAAASRPNCAPDPSRCGFPDETNTGVPAGTKLTVVTGDLTITRRGEVIEGKDIRGCVTIKARDVTIRRSRISCKDFYVIGSFSENYTGGGLLVEDVEINCLRTGGTGIGYYGFTARRVHIHDCENGFDIDSGASVLDSYVHSPYEGGSDHTDGIQLAGGSRITIRHNTIFNPGGTSAIISHPTENSDVLVSGNLLAGGAYTLYCPEESSSRYRVVGNRFSTLFSAKGGAYGPWVYCDRVAQATSNVWDRTLKPVG